mmetsp:Transcript_16381/g.36672  ORF Transcript_16381/g.36672 Transcript_16381/m.36672 type:complete len:217 (-) Transcript_16381:41-691(-)
MVLRLHRELLLPLLVHHILLSDQLLIPVNLRHDLLLILGLRGEDVLLLPLLELLDLLLVLHLHVVLRLQQELIILLVGVELLVELLARLLHLLRVVEIAQTQLVLVLHRQFFYLRLELRHCLGLLLQIRLRHQDLLGEGHHLLVSLRRAALLVPHVEDVYGGVFGDGEEERVVRCDPEASDWGRVDLDLGVISRQGELVRTDGAGLGTSEEHPARV